MTIIQNNIINCNGRPVYDFNHKNVGSRCGWRRTTVRLIGRGVVGVQKNSQGEINSTNIIGEEGNYHTEAIDAVIKVMVRVQSKTWDMRDPCLFICMAGFR